MRVLTIAEHAGGRPDDTALELAALARGLAGGDPVAAVVAGSGVDGVARELAASFDEVVVFDDPRLEAPDGDLWARLFAPLVAERAPDLVLAAHTNVGLDFAPALAGLAGLDMLADCLELEAGDIGFRAVRAVCSGKLRARVHARAPRLLATVRPGAVQAADPSPAAGGEVLGGRWPEGVEPRRRLVETVAPEAGAVDITQSGFLVAVGRGIEDEENLELVESLAEALGADLACTRPVVDKGWLEKNRQVGTSGRTVKPKAYLAIGVSGSFQHLGGVKGDPFLAAINKDPAAPIFDVADVGIVGDLFDLVPLLEKKVRQRKG